MEEKYVRSVVVKLAVLQLGLRVAVGTLDRCQEGIFVEVLGEASIRVTRV